MLKLYCVECQKVKGFDVFIDELICTTCGHAYKRVRDRENFTTPNREMMKRWIIKL